MFLIFPRFSSLFGLALLDLHQSPPTHPCLNRRLVYRTSCFLAFSCGTLWIIVTGTLYIDAEWSCEVCSIFLSCVFGRGTKWSLQPWKHIKTQRQKWQTLKRLTLWGELLPFLGQGVLNRVDLWQQIWCCHCMPFERWITQNITWWSEATWNRQVDCTWVHMSALKSTGLCLVANGENTWEIHEKYILDSAFRVPCALVYTN